MQLIHDKLFVRYAQSKEHAKIITEQQLTDPSAEAAEVTARSREQEAGAQ